MSAISTTALDLITGALRNINALEAGESPNAQDAADGLQVLNDLLESWSIDHLFIFSSTENILAWTPGQYQYTVGNPTATSPFTGYTTLGSPLITGITNASAITVAFGINGSGATVGGTLTDVQGAIPTGTTIVSLNTGSTSSITFTGAPTGTTATISGWAGGAVTGLITFSDGETRTASVTVGGVATWTPALIGTPTAAGNQINTTTMTMSANATQTLTSADSITYTVPGNFAIARPVRITDAFTRITQGNTGLDYPIDVDVTRAKYSAIGLKGIPGPWPILLYYDPTYSYGNIYCYPNPQLGGQLHLWTDALLSDFTSLTQPINLPQGYARAIKKNLALELAPEYGKTAGALLVKQAAESIAKIKSLNALPAVQAFFDRDIVRTRRTDAGWIYHGGFN